MISDLVSRSVGSSVNEVPLVTVQRLGPFPNPLLARVFSGAKCHSSDIVWCQKHAISLDDVLRQQQQQQHRERPTEFTSCALESLGRQQKLLLSMSQVLSGDRKSFAQLRDKEKSGGESVSSYRLVCKPFDRICKVNNARETPSFRHGWSVWRSESPLVPRRSSSSSQSDSLIRASDPLRSKRTAASNPALAGKQKKKLRPCLYALRRPEVTCPPTQRLAETTADCSSVRLCSKSENHLSIREESPPDASQRPARLVPGLYSTVGATSGESSSNDGSKLHIRDNEGVEAALLWGVGHRVATARFFGPQSRDEGNMSADFTYTTAGADRPRRASNLIFRPFQTKHWSTSTPLLCSGRAAGVFRSRLNPGQAPESADSRPVSVCETRFSSGSVAEHADSDGHHSRRVAASSLPVAEHSKNASVDRRTTNEENISSDRTLILGDRSISSSSSSSIPETHRTSSPSDVR